MCVCVCVCVCVYKKNLSQQTSSKSWRFDREYIFNYNTYIMNTRTRVSTLPKQVISPSQQTSSNDSSKLAASCRENACFHTTQTSHKVRVIKLVVKALINQQHLPEKNVNTCQGCQKCFSTGSVLKRQHCWDEHTHTHTHTAVTHTHIHTYLLTHGHIYSLVVRTPTN